LHQCIKNAKVILMRTTIDIPEGLLRQVKAQAALRGMKLKDYVTEALRAALGHTPTEARRSASEPESPSDELIVGERCIFPLINGEGGPALRDLTPERLNEILEEEDVDRAQHSGRR
jgi:Arc/MetJ family transcription regulator